MLDVLALVGLLAITVATAVTTAMWSWPLALALVAIIVEEMFEGTLAGGWRSLACCVAFLAVTGVTLLARLRWVRDRLAALADRRRARGDFPTARLL